VSQIEVVDLSQWYGSVRVLDQLDFTADAGMVVALVGPNGAGKTSLFRRAVGLLRGPGRFLICGRPYADYTHPTRVVGVSLDDSLIQNNLCAGRWLNAVASAAKIGRDRQRWCLERVNLSDVVNRRVSHLSAGMKQRLKIAGALLAEPRVLLLDEPWTGLDPVEADSLRGLLRAQADGGVTVVVSTHALSHIESVADSVIMLKNGRIIAHDALEGLLAARGRAVLVRVPVEETESAIDHLEIAGGRCARQDHGSIEVAGLDSVEVGRILWNGGLSVMELFTHRRTLEQAAVEAFRD